MRLAACLVICALILTAAPIASAASDDAIEAFAWGQDRAAALGGFTPGSDDELYYRCLLWQGQGRLAEVDEALARRADRIPTWQHQDEIATRQALLWMDRNPARGWTRLEKILLPDDSEAAAAPAAPGAFDPGRLATANVTADAITTSDGIRTLTEEGLRHLLPEVADPQLRHQMLAELRDPSAEGLVAALARDLTRADAESFGTLGIHALLTREQLAALARLVPAITGTMAYAQLVLEHEALAHADTLWRVDDRAFGAYVEDALARCVGPAFIHARRLLLHHLLERSRRRGAVDELLLRDLADAIDLPDQMALGRDSARAALGLPPEESTDRELIDRCLDSLLAQAPAVDPYADLIPAESRRSRFASAKVLAGVGDPARWMGALAPSAADEIAHRCEIAFAGDPARVMPVEDPVALELELKNAPQLRIRLFRLDAENIARLTHAPARIDMDLTAAVPIQEFVLRYDQPAYRRHREPLPLPLISGPGVWLVEASAGDRYARALIRRGELHALATSAVDGQHVQIIDEVGRPVGPDEVWVDGDCYRSDARGAVVVPCTEHSDRTIALLVGAGRVGLQTLNVQQRSCSLGATVVATPEQLRSGTEADILVSLRPALGMQVLPASAVRQAIWRCEWQLADATRLGGGESHLDLRQGPTCRVEVAVPSHVVGMSWSVEADIEADGATHQERMQGWEPLNGSYTTGSIVGAALRRDGSQWLLELHGLAGEALGGQLADLELTHAWLSTPVQVRARADDQGIIRLGELKQYSALSIGYPGETRRRGRIDSWTLDAGPQAPVSIAVAAGTPITVPWDTDRGSWSLFAGTDVTVLSDLSARIVPRQGRLELGALPAGSYILALRTPGTNACRVRVTVLAATITGDLLLGRCSATQASPPLLLMAPPQLTDTEVQVRLAGISPAAQLQLVALRTWPQREEDRHWFEGSAPWCRWEPPRCAVANDQAMDPEQQYILDRRDQQGLPGIMLARPGVVLDPWAPDPSSMVADGGTSGVLGCRDGGGRHRAVGKYGGARGGGFLLNRSSLEYLGAQAVVLDHVRPDAEGVVHIARARLGSANLLELQLEDGDRRLRQIAALPLAPMPLRERRLTASLPLDAPLAVTERWVALPSGSSVRLPSGDGTRMRLIDSAAAWYALLRDAHPGLGIDEFEPLTRWQDLGAQERAELLDRIACHETHLFLARHDPAWAAAVLAPYLANRMQPDRIDRMLSGQALDWSTQVAFDPSVNACERALACAHLPPAQAAEEVAFLSAQTARTPADPSALGRWFSAAFSQPDHGDRQQPDPNAPLATTPAAMMVSALVESRYYRIPPERPIPISPGPFWTALARTPPGTPFLPTTGVELLQSRTEVLMALAVADLPLRAAAQRRTMRADGAHLTVGSPALLAERTIEPAALRPGQVAVHLRVIARADGVQDADNPSLGPDLAPETPYRELITVCNLTPDRQDLDALAQIPAGAVPSGGTDATLVRHFQLAPYASLTQDLPFYFPEAGEHLQAAVRISSQGVLLAQSASMRWMVAAAHAPTDTVGDGQALLARLRQEPILAPDLELIRQARMPAPLARQVRAILRARRCFDLGIWLHALADRDLEGTRELIGETLPERVGPYFSAQLLTVDALSSGVLPVTDFTDALNPRIRPYAGARILGDARIHQAYSQVLDYLAHRPQLDDRDRLLLVTQLLLQDRVNEAFPIFDTIAPAALASRLQYDYCHAYLAVVRGQLAIARSIAARYHDHPVQHWRVRFRVLTEQVEAMLAPTTVPAGLTPSPEGLDAPAEAAMELRRQSATTCLLTLDRACDVELRWHPVDLEELFSTAPFAVSQQLDRFTAVAASETTRVAIPAGQRSALISVPAGQRAHALVLEAVCGPTRRTLLLPVEGLRIEALTDQAEVMVRDADGQPIVAAYVKVYCETGAGGMGQFLRDGYTDRRGRFAYRDPPAHPVFAPIAIFVDAAEKGEGMTIEDWERIPPPPLEAQPQQVELVPQREDEP